MSVKTKKKVLVTGAAGFIGSHLVDALVARGEPVRCFVRKKDSLEFLPRKGIEVVVGDIVDKKSLASACEGVKIIYHLAAKTDFEGKTWEEYYQPNVLGTENLIALAIKEKVKRFVFFSTIRVVGLGDSKIPVDETAPYAPINFYDKSKCEAEKRVLISFKKSKLPIVILRPTSVYGPRDRGTYFSFFKAIAQGKFFLVGSGKNLVSFVYVSNVVEATLLAGKSKKAIGQTYFINDDHPYTMEKLSKTIALAFGKKLLPLKLPRGLGYLLGYSFGLGKIFGFKPPLSPERVRNLTISYVFDISKAKKELGYHPKISLKEGVKLTAQWYEKHDWI
jgi:nucleoside-diphosphate-sugar epimerase